MGPAERVRGRELAETERGTRQREFARRRALERRSWKTNIGALSADKVLTFHRSRSGLGARGPPKRARASIAFIAQAFRRF